MSKQWIIILLIAIVFLFVGFLTFKKESNQEGYEINTGYEDPLPEN